MHSRIGSSVADGVEKARELCYAATRWRDGKLLVAQAHVHELSTLVYVEDKDSKSFSRGMLLIAADAAFSR